MSQSESHTARKVPIDFAIAVFGSVFVLYQMITVWWSVHGAMQHYMSHLVGVLVLAAFMIARRGLHSESGQINWADVLSGIVCGIFAVSAGSYLYLNAEMLEIMQPFVGAVPLVMGSLLIVAVLLAAWRWWGAIIALVCLLASLYFLAGHLLPSPFGIQRQPLNVVITFLSGIGGPRGVLTYMPLSADMIFLLLIYGGLLHGTRVIDMFAEIGTAFGNLLRGGVAFSAIVASALIGMVTGQAVSNIALSGVMTIPTMARNGFTKEEAGSVEVLASTGSQLLPPIMGLGAFLMAVNLGVSYVDIVIAGFIPGLLYMAAVAIGVYAMVGQCERPKTDRMAVNWDMVWWTLPAFALSFLTLIVLLVLRYSPALAGFWACVIVVGFSLLRPKRFRPNLSEIFSGGLTGLATAVQLAVVLSAIGLAVQSLSTTGLGVSAGRLVTLYSDGSLFLSLMIGMVVCLIIGMGLPTPAAYALIAIVVVPGLIDAGLSPLVANMYGFYFAIFSSLTPPVAVGILVAVRISGGSFAGTVKESIKLGGICVLVPFLFVSLPTMLDPEQIRAEAVVAIFSYLAATAMLAGAIYGDLGYSLSRIERAIFVICGPALFLAYLITHLMPIGLGCIAVLIFWIAYRRRLASSERTAVETG
ncbi:putative TRAP transporter, 4TM/12TM fusion protein [Candidatus Filomicrobium marinum]|uniref:TRAP transporter, 4TM/12TM fusion protein n=2 Tax=Filomicrobium TaxID=119044 RepID=A0A1H0HHL4_9HYPH|nr:MULTISPECIES: TRAP transporter fused permease subunit [Filomicrobium]MCV0367882.1 TRAP transporter fused permease subunit [Filomicrobium sp.]CFX19054.1 putative TRAP transporter, 4TM/12TM fusion protein [Candidatus Filomicrobium marinum]CPR18459.1 putative TRAP transporter, 4TM/12TM fusion protein [Candidatus Filomicrobium marinum]SDO18709.1 TRAP transporter, 4TM/12TM fusion protein [Filomicrobium insigne]